MQFAFFEHHPVQFWPLHSLHFTALHSAAVQLPLPPKKDPIAALPIPPTALRHTTPRCTVLLKCRGWAVTCPMSYILNVGPTTSSNAAVRYIFQMAQKRRRPPGWPFGQRRREDVLPLLSLPSGDCTALRMSALAGATLQPTFGMQCYRCLSRLFPLNP